jgi:hypothetical protein
MSKARKTLNALVLLISATLPPDFALASSCASESGLHSKSGETQTSIAFSNERNRPIRVFWIDYNGARKFYAQIASGGSKSFATYATHPWVVLDASGNCLGVWFADVGGNEITIR